MNAGYAAIIFVAMAAGAVLYRWLEEPPRLSGWQKLGVGLGAFCGGMIGAKLPFVLSDWHGLVSGAAWFDDGKTIVSGLVGGYLGVQLAEWALDLRDRVCDGAAVPLAVAIAIGRLGCFHAGCCAGTATTVPWAVAFHDGIPRHPTQLYEAAFHLTAAVVLLQLQRRNAFRGQLVRFYFVAYFLFRFVTEFLRPEPPLWLGLTGYQWAALVLAPFFLFWCCPGCRKGTSDDPQKRWLFDPRSFCRTVDGRARAALRNGLSAAWLSRKGTALLDTTDTHCPVCLASLPGEVYQEQGRVYLRRHCPQHGSAVAMVSSDRRHYYLRHEAPHPADRCCCRGSTARHRTCVALLEITQACNLHCPVCFAESPGNGQRLTAELLEDLERFLEARGPLDVLQLSGGEPLLHPDLLRILDHCRTLPIEHLAINTNGLRLAEDSELIDQLAARRPRLEINLQWDGCEPETSLALRGQDLTPVKRKVLERLAAAGLPTTLVATLVRGVNEHEVGGIVRLALSVPQVRGITFQPATWSGRFDRPANPLDRLTLADVIRLASQQSGGLLAEDDFLPLPCSSPNCCSFTYLARLASGGALPLPRIIDYRKHLDRLSDRINFNLADAAECTGGGQRPEDFLRIVIKPFMDAHTFDRRRAEECCIHVIRPGGQPVSFCVYNALVRGRADSAGDVSQPTAWAEGLEGTGNPG